MISAAEAKTKRAKVNTVGHRRSTKSSPEADLTRTAAEVLDDAREQTPEVG